MSPSRLFALLPLVLLSSPGCIVPPPDTETPPSECASPESCTAGPCVCTDDLSRARGFHTATLLPSGQVLVVGGFSPSGDSIRRTAELYDPATGTWTPTGSTAALYGGHTATLLPDGRVLIVGGRSDRDIYPYKGTAELYDPAKGTWTPTGGSSTPGAGHTATLLPDGRVLLVGGRSSETDPKTSVRLYDPATDTWSLKTPMQAPRYMHTATLLADGQVLIAGGNNVTLFHLEPRTELYDPATDSWRFAGALAQERSNPTATLLPSGQVLVAGGATNFVLNEMSLYDPALGVWRVGPPMNTARLYHTATPLPDGRVLVTGGRVPPKQNSDLSINLTTSVDVYDPATETWSASAPLLVAREGHTATLLPDGSVLITGGGSVSAEILRP